MTNAVLGIDVSRNTFDTNLGAGTKARSKSFANSPDGWHHLIAWLGEHKIGQVHACLEATGRPGLGIVLALHEAGHVVSIALLESERSMFGALVCLVLSRRHKAL